MNGYSKQKDERYLTHNLKARLLEKFAGARHSVRIAVAWFTDGELLRCITECASRGLKVEVVISDHPYNFEETYSLDFSEFQHSGGRLYVWKENFFHSKFSIIDNAWLFTGSANYTYNGFHKNREATILVDDPQLIAAFSRDFEEIASFFKVEASMVLSPLKFFYQREISLLYENNNWMEGEIAGCRKLIEQYEVVFRLRFQEVIAEILYLRKVLAERRHALVEKPETRKASREAGRQWEAFQQASAAAPKQKEELNDTSLQARLKKLYRDAAKLCHPDNPTIPDDRKELANRIFNLVKAAFDNNDEAALLSLLEDLQSGLAFRLPDVEAKTYDELEALYQKLKDRHNQLLEELDTLREDPRYRVMQMDDLESHFEEREVILREELRVMKEKYVL